MTLPPHLLPVQAQVVLIGQAAALMFPQHARQIELAALENNKNVRLGDLHVAKARPSNDSGPGILLLGQECGPTTPHHLGIR